jgi:hypothetical protein
VRRALAVLALAAATAVLAACGGGGGVSSDSVANAGTKTSKVKSYRVTTTTTMKLPTTSREVSFRGDGAFDPTARRGRMQLDLSDLNLVLGPQGSPYNFGYAQLVMRGVDMYMRIPFLKQVEPSLKPWIKINLDQAGRAQGIDFSSFLQFGEGGNPTQALEYLRGAGKVTKVGTDEVRGVKTTHYKATIDLRKVAAEAPAKSRASLRRTINRIIALTGESTFPAEIWIDDQGLVRRERYKETLTILNTQTRVSASMELYDFGTPVIAPVPPPSLVSDLTGVAGAQS